MGATVKWREDRGAWFLYVCANGTRTAKRYGHTAADKRRAERHAREVNREQTRGRLGLQKKEKKNRFDVFAKRWVEEKVILPAERGLDDAVAPTAEHVEHGLYRIQRYA